MTGVLSFNSQSLLQVLSSASRDRVLTFALATVSRQIGALEHLAKLQTPLDIAYLQVTLSKLLDAAESRTTEATGWEECLEKVMDTLPDEESRVWSRADVFFDHAATGLAYAVRYLIKLDPQEAVWAAQKAYEAADQVAIWSLSVSRDALPAEGQILRHPVVQTELARQTRDASSSSSIQLSRAMVVSRREHLLDMVDCAQFKWT